MNLKIPDTLAKTGPSTAEQLAKAVGAPNARWLERVLRAAVALDLLNAKNPKKSVASGDKASETLYSLTGLTSCLRSNDPTMISALVKLNEYNYDTATHLTEVSNRANRAFAGWHHGYKVAVLLGKTGQDVSAIPDPPPILLGGSLYSSLPGLLLSTY